MKRFLFALTIILAPLLAEGFSLCGQWSYAFRVGPSFLVDNSNVNSSDDFGDVGNRTLWGHVGPLLDGKIGYGLGDYIVLGVESDWEYHRFPSRALVDSGGDTLNIGGRFQTASVMAFIEIRPFTCWNFVPYISVGGGGNFNWVNNINLKNNFYSDGTKIINHFKAANTWAAKGAVGFDYLFDCNVAFNMEAGWLWNRGKWNIRGTDSGGDLFTINSGFNCSSASLLCGFRLFY